MSWTVLSAQTLSKDTVKCYGPTILRQIALKLTKASLNDSLLKATNLQLKNTNEIVVLKDKQIVELNKIIIKKDTIISLDKIEHDKISLKLDKDDAKIKNRTIGMLSSIGLVVMLIAFQHL